MDFLYQLLQGAVESGASDIHLKGESPIFFRISGQLHPVEGEVLPCTTCDAIVNFLIPAHLKTQFRDSREVDFSFQVPNIGRFRANIFYQRGDLSLAIRNVKTKVPSFSDLHLPESFGPLALSPNGIILVCGSTGSGKSSTLAAIIDHINRSHRLHIITLEDPIEYVFTDDQSVINQREIGLDTASFKNGLVQIMRQDPDVIMIGEMRDSASISAAMSAAETGHLVLSTLHSSSAPQAVTRILDFFPPESREQARKQMALCLR
ncbi:MAG: PilT/PilU family type 4a pilus ATPase, partial [Verrucomicrobiae bacterium]|nr:PilT/PilU family type 4a pilus ATPase [Verrucomicrobiae bacterium]